VVDDEGPVGVHGRGEPVGDADGGAALQQHFQGGLDLCLGLQVQVRGGLVQDQDARLGQERPGEVERVSPPCDTWSWR
jgi:hypothetical protein